MKIVGKNVLENEEYKRILMIKKIQIDSEIGN